MRSINYSDFDLELSYSKWLSFHEFVNKRKVCINYCRLIHLLNSKNEIFKMVFMEKKKGMLKKQRLYRRLQKTYAIENKNNGFYKNFEID